MTTQHWITKARGCTERLQDVHREQAELIASLTYLQLQSSNLNTELSMCLDQLSEAPAPVKSCYRRGDKVVPVNPNRVPANVLLYFKQQYATNPEFQEKVDPNKADPAVYKPGTTPDTLQLAVAKNVGSNPEGSVEYIKAKTLALYSNLNDDFKDTLRKERTALATLRSAQDITPQLGTDAATTKVGDILDPDF